MDITLVLYHQSNSLNYFLIKEINDIMKRETMPIGRE